MNSLPTLPAPGEGSEPQLLEELRLRILRDGPLTFAEYMELALYHSQWGYYSRAEDPIGRSGDRDFYTAPARHPAFGTLLGRQVAQCLDKIGGGEREWVEFGPGGGHLAASLAMELRRHGLGPATGIRATLVEANRHRRAMQEDLLRSQGLLDGVQWLTPQEWSASDEAVRGCVIANEVLDALPVHRLVWRDGDFSEIRVGWEDLPVEVFGPVAGEHLLDQIRAVCPAPREGQELEVGMEALRWIRRLASRLEQGYAILLDYGYLSSEIDSPRHHRGTLLGYYRHAVTERYLDRIGRQDLTAHVNFSSVLEAAVRCGMQARGPVTQGRFLLALGALDWFAESAEDASFAAQLKRKAVQDLFLPSGMGESHQVVVLATAGCELDLKGLEPAERWQSPKSNEEFEASAGES
ncbi:MAG: SAM-dependent methyltransferase [Acidobacteria bacterium]|nr:SAM-dependent methyltransferase [Acidobacteriota bacterium]